MKCIICGENHNKGKCPSYEVDWIPSKRINRLKELLDVIEEEYVNNIIDVDSFNEQLNNFPRT